MHDESTDEIVEDSLEAAALVTSPGQWVPVPLPVSNPDVGTGLQVMLLYLHAKDDEDAPNTTSGLVGMYTDTDSWFLGLIHDDYWQDDTIRLSAFVGTGQLNLSFYGINENPLPDDLSIPYEFDMDLASVKVQYRLPRTENWFAGLKYKYLDSRSVFRFSDRFPPLPDIPTNFRTSGIGIPITFDSRDDNYYPTSGQWFEATWMRHDEAWGADSRYDKSSLFFNHYQPLDPGKTLVFRTRIESGSGDVPFFDLPYLQMSGFSRDRYRADHTLSLHSEGRFKLAPRWGAVAFYEAGWFGDRLREITNGRRITSYGFGLRWQVSADRSMNLGIDAAFSSDDDAVYVQVGERF